MCDQLLIRNIYVGDFIKIKRYGDLVACKKIVKSGKTDDINRPSLDFFANDSPYQQACRFGHLSVVKYLLALKCQEHTMNGQGQNALMLAASFG